MSPTRQRWFDELVPKYRFVADRDLDGRSLIVEIGCGKGDATAAMAPADAPALVVACEPNEATCAHLASLLDARGIDNVRLWIGDAFSLLAMLGPQSVAEIRVWFPDPWPKPRQAQKRLTTPLRLALIIEALHLGGVLRLASDDANYAAQAFAAMQAEPRLAAAIVSRPQERPVTVFEARGIREGHAAVDLLARRVPPEVEAHLFVAHEVQLKNTSGALLPGLPPGKCP